MMSLVSLLTGVCVFLAGREATGQSTSYTAAFSANLYERPAGNPLPLDITTINRGNHLNEATHTLTIPSDGVYIGMISAGVPRGVEAAMEIHIFSNRVFSCYRDPNSQQGHDTYSRDVLLMIEAGTVLTSASIRTTYSSPASLLTSWGTASLPAGVGNFVAFQVSRSTNFTPGIMSYPDVHFNIGNGWDANNNRFVAPRSGTYFFSYATRVAAGVRVQSDLLVNGDVTVNILRMSTAHTGDDTLSRSALLTLTTGDQVTIRSGFPGVTNANNHTTFSGFLYDPPQTQRRAWGAYRSSGWLANNDPVPYDYVTVNDGTVWEGDHAKCDISGVYYVYISAGLMTHLPVELTIVKNLEPMGSLSRDDIIHNGVDTFGRSMLIECTAGDVLWVSATIGTELYSDLYLQTSFIGFYLYP